MRCLTILLDPGRLKRGVGPNRELGSPLRLSHVYTLVIRQGLTDLSGRPLLETVNKRFRVTDAVREPVAVEQWKILPPEINSHQPLVLVFPRALDWALLSHAITIASKSEQSIEGQIVIDQFEKRWSFTPALPWTAAPYCVRIASSLEDVCGNSVMAAFDRPLRPSSDLANEAVRCSIQFHPV
jgi:hypothetical protein